MKYRYLALILVLFLVGCQEEAPVVPESLIPESLQEILTPEQQQDYLAKMEEGTIDENYLMEIIGVGAAAYVIGEIIDEVGDIYEKKHKKPIVKYVPVPASSVPKSSVAPATKPTVAPAVKPTTPTPTTKVTPPKPAPMQVTPTRTNSVRSKVSSPPKRTYRPSFGRKRR